MSDKRVDDVQNGETGQPDGAYDVGYGKPPVQGRFKPGQSGNPCGKRKSHGNFKGSITQKKLDKLLLEDAHRPFPIRDGEKSRNEPFVKAVIRSVGLHAIKGNAAAQKHYLTALAAAERSSPPSSSNSEMYDISKLTESEALQLMTLLSKAKAMARVE
jgi:hypothetical protein